MTTKDNKIPSDVAIRVVHEIEEATKWKWAESAQVVMANIIDKALTDVADKITAPMAEATRINQEIHTKLSWMEQAAKTTIHPGDVVTLASGGAQWTVIEVMITTKGEHVAYLAQDAQAGVRTWWTGLAAMRKVEPEPPRQDMDEETRRHIYDVVKEWTKAWDEEPRASILQRWLDAGAPLQASAHAMDEEMRAALVKCADLFLEWHSERHPPNAYPVLAAKIQRWLDAQGVK